MTAEEESKAFEAALAKLKALMKAPGGLSSEQMAMVIATAVDGLIENVCSERRLKNEVESERDLFETLSRSSEVPPTPYCLIRAIAFRRWVKHSPNLFADAYRLGAKNAAAEITKKNVKRAARGRRLIGAASRAKVAKTAEDFRHLSKEKAAASLAEIVNLDPGTIRRYLSELFPGDKWRL